MKIDITCQDCLCLAQLIEYINLMDDPLYASLCKRLNSALVAAGYRPVKEDEILLPIVVDSLWK